MSLQSEEIQAKREGKLLSRRTFIKATSAALAVTAAAALGIKTKEAEASDSAQPPGNEFLQQALPTSVEFQHYGDDRFIENLPGPAGSNQEFHYFQAQDEDSSHVIVMVAPFDPINRTYHEGNFAIEGLPPIRYNHPYVKLLDLPDSSHLAFINSNDTPEIRIYKIDPQTRTATFLCAHTLGSYVEGQIDAFKDPYDSGKIKYAFKDPNSLNLCFWEYVPETNAFNLIAGNIKGAPSVLSARRLSDHWLLIASEPDPGAVPASNIILSTVDMYSPQTNNQTFIESASYSGAEVVSHPRSGAMFCYVNKDGHPCVEFFDPRTREHTLLLTDSHYAEINRPNNNYPKGETMSLFYHPGTDLWYFRFLDTSGNIWETRIDGGGVIVQDLLLIGTATIMETGGWGQIPHYI